MPFADWALFLGVFLLTMVLANTLLAELPLTSAMVYLATGWALGPALLDVLKPDPIAHAGLLERVSEMAVLVSLFSVGLGLGIPLRDWRWRLPVKLAFLSLALIVGMIAVLGVVALGLDPGAAVLLGAILAPTDPVLASSLQPGEADKPHRLSFTLAAEGGLNDGAAFPFVVLGLALTGLQGRTAAEWLGVDLIWATAGGLAIGAMLAAAVGRLVVLLRSRWGHAVGLDVFLGFGLIATAYGVAHLCAASTFLAVFAAGLALRRVAEQPEPQTQALDAAEVPAGHSYATLARHPHHASETMRSSVERFNEQIERIAEMGLVLLVGAMLPYAALLPATLWFVPLLLLVLRPVSVLVAYVGERDADLAQFGMTAWFGIRGIGSVFYLLLVLRTGVAGAVADVLVSLTLWTVAASVVAHGLTARPLMRRYLRRSRD